MVNTVYYDTAHIPLAITLRANWLAIRDEVDALFNAEGAVPKVNAVMMGQDGRYLESVGRMKYTGMNASLHLQVVPDLLDPPEAKIALTPAGEAGRAKRRAACPIIMGLLTPYKEHIGNIGFNRLFPGGVINPHYGVITADKYVRLHLGLHTDPGAKFYAQDHEPYTWQDGETMAFDDAKSLHWVKHEGNQPRTILCLDVAKAAFDTLRFL